MGKHLSAKTITCHLQTIRLFFDYLNDDEGIKMVNPVTKISIRLPKPLPRHLKDDQVGKLLAVITDPQRQGHVHGHASMWSASGGGLPAHRGCSGAYTEPALCRQRKGPQGQGCLFE